MAEFIPYTTEQILDLFKSAFYEQTSQTLRIGSEEFAFSSVAAYVLRVFEQSMQHGADQCSIETATSEALDAIGSSFGLSRYNIGQTARCGLTVTNTTESVITINSGEIFWENSEVEFQNREPVVLSAGANEDVLLWATDSGSKYNGISDIEPDPITGISFSDISTTYGGVDSPLPYSTENDDIYRTYIKSHIKSFGVGTAEYYEQLCLEGNDGIITSAYCLRDGDDGFEAGKVKLYVCFKTLPRTSSSVVVYIGTEAFRQSIINALNLALNASNRKCVTDLVVVQTSLPSVPAVLQLQNVIVAYESRFKALNSEGVMLAEAHYNKCIDQYRRYLLEKCNRPFIASELETILTTTDEDGVYCTSFVCDRAYLGVTPPGATLAIVATFNSVSKTWI